MAALLTVRLNAGLRILSAGSVRFSSSSTTAEKCKATRLASIQLSQLSHEQRNEALQAVSRCLVRDKEAIEKANELDCVDSAKPEAGVSPALQARLKFAGSKFDSTIKGVEDLIELPDPIGDIQLHRKIANGLTLKRVTVPLGVLGIIFEARPDAAVQIASLAIKSGNGVLLKCGREAVRTCQQIVKSIREGLQEVGVPPEVVELFTTREETRAMMDMKEYVDLIIPRGSNEFVKYVMANTDIPVLGHADGICHVFVDKEADVPKALSIVVDSKTQYPAACNSMETLLVHKDVARSFLPAFAHAAKTNEIQLRCDSLSMDLAKPANPTPVSEEDWRTEYCDKICSVKIVESTEEAIQHINTYGSRHTDCIVTQNEDEAKKFCNQVLSAGVYWNCSTRFADGFRYGFGAEVGVSTSIMPPRGPVGLEGIVTYKYYMEGDGHTVDDFSAGRRTYDHVDLPKAKAA